MQGFDGGRGGRLGSAQPEMLNDLVAGRRGEVVGVAGGDSVVDGRIRPGRPGFAKAMAQPLHFFLV